MNRTKKPQAQSPPDLSLLRGRLSLAKLVRLYSRSFDRQGKCYSNLVNIPVVVFCRLPMFLRYDFTHRATIAPMPKVSFMFGAQRFDIVVVGPKEHRSLVLANLRISRESFRQEGEHWCHHEYGPDCCLTTEFVKYLPRGPQSAAEKAHAT